MPAIGRNSGEVAPHDRRTEGVKGARDELKKKDAGKGLNWGTLYMNVSIVFSFFGTALANIFSFLDFSRAMRLCLLLLLDCRFLKRNY